MSFLNYPHYKESSVEWLGAVPAHWAIDPLHSVVVERSEPNVGMAEDNLLSLSYGRIVAKDISSNDGLLPESFETYQIVKPGDIVFRLTDLQNDKRSLRSALVEKTGIITSAYLAVAPHRAYPKYLHYLFRAYDSAKIFYSMGGGLRQSMKFSDLKRLPVLLPGHAEQTLIAAFLDRETAKIDELIAEQQRLIELLKEKRQAIISHAVTKGLNPDARMKPSGIACLGQIPDAWRIMPLKRLIERDSSISYGIVQPGPPLEDGVPFVQTTNMSTGDFELAKLQKTTAAIAAQYPRSLLVGGEVILGIRASIGAAHVVPPHLAGANLSRGVARIVPNSNISSEYLVAYFGTNAVSTFWQLSKQGSTFNEVSIETVRELPVCVPCSDEQAKIVKYLDIELRRYGALTAEANRSVELLQERRNALISAAVTGQIDVRELAERKAA